MDADEETVDAASLTSSSGSAFAVRFGIDLLVTPPALVLRSGDFFAAKRRRATGAGFLAAPVVLLRGRGGAVRGKGVGAKRELTGGVDGDASDVVAALIKIMFEVSLRQLLIVTTRHTLLSR